MVIAGMEKTKALAAGKNGHTKVGKKSKAAENGAAKVVEAEDVEEGEVLPMDAEGGRSGDEGPKVDKSSVEDGKVDKSGDAGQNDNRSEEENESDDEEEDEAPGPMSKSALKNAEKARRYKIKKKMRKAAEKEKRHEESKRKRKEWEEKLALMTEEEREKAKQEKTDVRKERKDEQKQRKDKLREALTSGQNYVIDLEFSHLMKPQELTSLIQQVMYSYAANARAEHPGRITLTGVTGTIQESLEKISGYKNWLLHKEEASYLDVFKDRKEDLVYLTADSETILEELDSSKIYIVGGLVDRNRWKNITLDKAKEQGIATAKLPVGDHLKMAGSKVLTVNQVMELLLCFQKLKDWKQTLRQVVPLRKRAAEGDLERDEKEEKEES
ncbi:tRNA (guanine9-N1)-methyltransferase [Marchantia polymorpha subsp. ruderalis]|uniref:tRNA (guanine(9)-N(1))-methyltransferase n=2 Tax=Marchantia polymorpha TaxID=3197 RepID=A0A176WGK1_MARPO|nr:hypothetical protein AXG93_1962s1330 [Marchantia polymorpha subsp. ruderalis]PTQ46514.1 hypothetical protein MARPO_0011s0174 [Marchantia polymorpha]BBN08477.1 hypothetical protein Mp_4g11890 [Marchantia polymorpha subsp. ruderalis]|eukprot:PTQ46514.1 hypothetical protein MARPO_0011s0174 [Marchantia polymorpha]